MCWIKESNPAPVQRWLFCLNTWNIFYVVLPAGGNELQFSGQSTRGWLPLYNSGVNTSSQWAHFAVTYAPEGVNFYKNGELVSTSEGMGNLVRNGAKTPFYIGIMDPTRELYFEGELDEIRLYNKVLDNDAIAGVFAMEKPSTMEIDKTALNEAVRVATEAKNNVTVGFAKNEYLARNVAAFDEKITAATKLLNTPTLTQSQADKAADALTESTKAFTAAKNHKDYNPNLVLQLSFDSTSADSSYLSNQCSYVAGASGLPPYPTTDRRGRYDSSVYFDKGSYISAAYAVELNPVNLTCLFWVKTDTECGKNDPYLVSLGRKLGYYIGVNQGNVVLGGKTTKGTLSLNSGIKLETEWSHLAVSYGDDGAKFYKNGVLVKTFEYQGDLITLPEPMPLYIGVKSTIDNLTSYFKGELDEVMLFDKQLSDDDITSIFNEQK